MQKKLQYIVFASFILCLTTISYASTPMLYFVDKVSNKLNVCSIHEYPHLDNCRELFEVPHINSVAVSPDGHNVFYSTELNEVYACIKNDDGSLSPCKPYKRTFNNPKGMTFDRTHYLYVTNAGDNSVSVCTYGNHGQIYSCFKAAENLEISPVSIAISFDDKYSYLASPENGQIAICPLNSNLTFGKCNYMNSYGYLVSTKTKKRIDGPISKDLWDKTIPKTASLGKPISVAADPLGKNIYILNASYSKRSGISCMLSTQFPTGMGICKDTFIDPFFDLNIPQRSGSAMDIIPHPYADNAVLSFVAVGSGINYCILHNNQYHCSQTSAQYYGYISSVAYAASQETHE